MSKSKLYCFFMVMYMVIVILLLRIILPLFLEVEVPVLREIVIDVTRVFIVIIAVVISITLLITLAFCAFHFGDSKSFAMLIPLNLVIIFATHASLIKFLIPQLGNDAVLAFLRNAMINLFTNKNDFMSQLQTELKCCGIWGPPDYLLYMEKVHSSCYHNMETLDPSKLFTRGCLLTMNELLGPIQYLALILGWGSLILEFACLVFSIGIFAQRFIKNNYKGCLRKF